MPLVNLNSVLEPAFKNQYAIGAFNVINSDMLQAIIAASEKKKSPVIINIAEVHFPFCDLEIMTTAIKKAAEKAAIPVVLHLDHGLSFDTVVRAINLGFTSVMFDGSTLDYDENVKQTKEIVKMCHAAGIPVEAELGAVGGEEGGGLFGSSNPALYTNTNQAVDYVKQTNVDALAVAIGNSHGKYKGEPKLDFDRLEEIKNVTNIPLVLHGGSGIPDSDIRKAIAIGISKINFYTGMSGVAIETLKEEVKITGLNYNELPEILQKVKNNIQKVVEHQIDVFSNGKSVKY